VERLDTLCWRALKNQTTSRSKLGQEPRLYLRAEYESENYHIGGLHELLDLGEDSADSLRSVNDVVVDASDLVAALNNASDRIKTLHVVADDRINLEVDGDDARRRLRRPPRRLRSRHPPNRRPRRTRRCGLTAICEHPDVTTNRRRRRPRPLPVVHGRVHLGPLQACRSKRHQTDVLPRSTANNCRGDAGRNRRC